MTAAAHLVTKPIRYPDATWLDLNGLDNATESVETKMAACQNLIIRRRRVEQAKFGLYTVQTFRV